MSGRGVRRRAVHVTSRARRPGGADWWQSEWWQPRIGGNLPHKHATYGWMNGHSDGGRCVHTLAAKDGHAAATGHRGVPRHDGQWWHDGRGRTGRSTTAGRDRRIRRTRPRRGRTASKYVAPARQRELRLVHRRHRRRSGECARRAEVRATGVCVVVARGARSPHSAPLGSSGARHWVHVVAPHSNGPGRWTYVQERKGDNAYSVCIAGHAFIFDVRPSPPANDMDQIEVGVVMNDLQVQVQCSMAHGSLPDTLERIAVAVSRLLQ